MAMFHLLKIRTSIEIFKNEKCKVTFGLEYIISMTMMMTDKSNYSETLNGLTKLVVKYILNRGTSLSISYRNHQIHSQLILWF